MKIGSFSGKYKNLSEPVKASFWYIVCNVLNKGIALISTPIFTRILTEEEYGTFLIFQSWYGIILIFTSLNSFLGGYTKGLLLYKDKRQEFTSSLLALTTVITCFFGLVYLADIKFWTGIFDLTPVLMLAMFIELLLMPAVEFWSTQERFDYQYKKYVMITVAMTVISLGGGVAAVLSTTHKVEARVFTDVGAKVIFAVFLFGMIIYKGRTLYNKAYWLYTLKFNIPLIPHYLSNYVLNQSDRIMIGKMVGNEQAAYYGVAYTISTMMNLIMTAINNSLTPYIYKAINGGESSNVKKVTRPLFVLMAALSILTMVFAPEIIFIFAGRSYAEAIYVIPPIAASVFFIFLYAMFSNIEYYYQKTGYIAIATCMSAALNLLLNYLFIPVFGYYAAGYTTLVCYICLAVLHYVFYKRVLRREMPKEPGLYDMKTVIGASAVVLLVMLGMTLTYQWLIVRYAEIVCMVIAGLVWRKELIAAVTSLKK